MKVTPDYDSIILTEQEEKEALFEGKVKKHFREKGRPYWEANDPDLKPDNKPASNDIDNNRPV